MKYKKLLIHEPLFNSDFLIHKGGSVNDLIKSYSKKVGIEPHLLPEASGRVGHTCFCTHTKSVGIWISERATIGVISHEVFHAVHSLMHRSGLKLNFQNDETYAYYLQFLVDKITLKLFGKSKL